MKEIREWIREMDAEEKKEAIESAIGWVSLFWLAFMISIIGG